MKRSSKDKSKNNTEYREEYLGKYTEEKEGTEFRKRR